MRSLSRGTLVLSYDDGPGDTLTPDLLQLLKEEGARATFFMIGEEAQARPERVTAVLAGGHEIGSHTQSHTNAWKVPPWRSIRDMQAGRRTIDQLGGQGDLFRPPYGKVTLGNLLVGIGWRMGWWTVDPQDSWAPRSFDEVLKAVEAQEGGVVLLHDFDRVRRASLSSFDHHDYVMKLTKQLIALAKDKGWPIKTVGEIL